MNCSKCGAVMAETITGCEILGRYSTANEGFINTGKQFRKDTGEEIKIKFYKCPNYGKRTQYNWWQIVILGYYKYDENHDRKGEYINHDNPKAWII